MPDTRRFAYDDDPSAAGYDRPVDPYAGQAGDRYDGRYGDRYDSQDRYAGYPATESYPPAGYPSQVLPPQQQPPRPRNRLAIAGTIGAVIVSIGLALALLSPVFTGRSTSGKAPTLPGVLEDPSPGGQAQAPAPTPSAETPPDLPSEPPTATPDPTDKVVTGNTGVENAVVALVNNERRKRKKCDPVQNDDRLRGAARQHSADMAAGGFLRHNGSDGSSADDRMRAAGVDDPLSENLARGFRSAEDVVDAWMKSKAQRGNILDCDARSIGVGVAVAADGTPYWTQNFGQ